MKNNLFTTLLTWLLATSAVLSIVFCLQLLFRTRDLRRFQSEVATYQNRHAAMNALLTDVADYSRRDPAIDPILESIGIRTTRTNPAAATAPKPAGK